MKFDLYLTRAQCAAVVKAYDSNGRVLSNGHGVRRSVPLVLAEERLVAACRAALAVGDQEERATGGSEQ